jgi:hypothetical protein
VDYYGQFAIYIRREKIDKKEYEIGYNMSNQLNEILEEIDRTIGKESFRRVASSIYLAHYSLVTLSERHNNTQCAHWERFLFLTNPHPE